MERIALITSALVPTSAAVTDVAFPAVAELSSAHGVDLSFDVAAFCCAAFFDLVLTIFLAGYMLSKYTLFFGCLWSV